MSTVMHPAVAQIHGVESWRGRPCLVVEFLPGGTLEDRLRDGPLAPAQAVSVVARLADALAALHEKGCLHGDVKPSNIGFTAEGAPCCGASSHALTHAPDRVRFAYAWPLFGYIRISQRAQIPHISIFGSIRVSQRYFGAFRDFS